MSRGAKIGLWVLILAVVVILFVVTGARRLQKEEVQSIEAVHEVEGIPVDIVRAQVLSVEDWREFAGVAEGLEQVNLVAPFRTRVQGVHVEVGDEVPAGKVIVSLDPYDPAHFAMNLQTARTQYETAKQDSLRMEGLYRSGAVSEQDLDHVRATTSAAHAHYRTARRAVELDTPIAGIVTSVTVEDGDYAAGEQTLATVAFYDRIRIPLEVSERERSLIELGQRVRVGPTDAASRTRGCSTGPEGPAVGGRSPALLGTVTRAALSADPTTRLFLVEVVVDNPNHLLQPGTLVTPRIRVASIDDQPVIPPAAILTRNGAEYVYVVEDAGGDANARVRDVVPSVENGALVAISEGLSPGEQVVVWGQNNLNDGVKVKIHADRTEEYFNRAGR